MVKIAKPIRFNVLLLVGVGYGVVMVMFIAMCWKGGMNADKAYNVLEGPLMALIGGSLAIAKDLISADDDSSTKDKKSPEQGDETTSPAQEDQENQ